VLGEVEIEFDAEEVEDMQRDDIRQAYLSVHSKGDIFRIWDTKTELVQETFLCR
jgi:hypothetical protein